MPDAPTSPDRRVSTAFTPGPHERPLGLAFVDTGLGHDERERTDAERQALWRADDDADVYVLWRGRAFVRAGDAGPAPVPAAAVRDAMTARPEAVLYLGHTGARPVLGFDLPGDREPSGLFGDERLGGFEEIRDLSFRGGGNPLDLSRVGLARGLFDWRRRHMFCARCGSGTDVAHAGWRSRCPACGTEHYPRVDPVAIMLITHGERMLLGRQGGWPEGMFSCLAGFVEPGETLEAAARREAREEAGATIGPVRYVRSQPWPFPGSLMLGVHAEALNDAAEADGVELAEVRWFDREDAAALVSGTLPNTRIPPPSAIATSLIVDWARPDRRADTQ